MKVTLEKKVQRRSRAAHRQVTAIVQRGLAAGRGRRFEVVSMSPVRPQPMADGWQYTVEIEFRYTGQQAERHTIDNMFAGVKDAMAKATSSNGGWNLKGYTPRTQAAILSSLSNTPDVIAHVEVEKDGFFDHLYGLDPQIDVLLSSLRIAQETEWKKRFHVVLYGQPGCGKSAILQGLKEMAGADGALEFDGTQTTAAGAIATLIDADVLPPILLIEEIEKVPDAPFLWLLAALDFRSEIRKITRGNVFHRKVPFVCVATVNDIALFRSRHDGAMASRFAHQIHCPRPSKEVLHRILEREVEEISGKPEWIEPAIEYCTAEENTSDPRRVISVCLTGRDQLLDGSFQTKLRACREKTA